jgi:hypothetical protein
MSCEKLTSVGYADAEATSGYYPLNAPGLQGYNRLNLDDLTYAECFAHPRFTVGQAIIAILGKARRAAARSSERGRRVGLRA